MNSTTIFNRLASLFYPWLKNYSYRYVSSHNPISILSCHFLRMLVNFCGPPNLRNSHYKVCHAAVFISKLYKDIPFFVAIKNQPEVHFLIKTNSLPIKWIRLKSLTSKLLQFQCIFSLKKEVKMVSQLKGGETHRLKRLTKGKAMENLNLWK